MKCKAKSQTFAFKILGLYITSIYIDFQTQCKEDPFFVCDEIGETLEHVAQRGGGFCIPGNIEGQIEWDSKQPNLVEDNPVYHKVVELDGL